MTITEDLAAFRAYTEWARGTDCDNCHEPEDADDPDHDCDVSKCYHPFGPLDREPFDDTDCEICNCEPCCFRRWFDDAEKSLERGDMVALGRDLACMLQAFDDRLGGCPDPADPDTFTFRVDPDCPGCRECETAAVVQRIRQAIGAAT